VFEGKKISVPSKTDSDSYQDGPPWWKVTIALKAIRMIGAGNMTDGKMYVIAWCE
jgi:hypothetical protein